MKTILLDVGGSYIKCSDGRVIPVNSDGTREEIASSLREALGDADAAAVAIPGPFDYRQGIFRMKHKYAAVYGERFADLVAFSATEGGIPEGASAIFSATEGMLPSRAQKPTLRFMHDVNAPLAGAIRMMGLRNAALVTLGTGLGFSFALNGKVQENETGSPAISLWNRPWNGGILEEFVSARAICNSYSRKTGEPCQSAREVAVKAGAGDTAAREAYAELGATLGQALHLLLRELDIHTLLMGGQISRSLDLMAIPLQDALKDVCLAPAPEGAVFEGLATLFETSN